MPETCSMLAFTMTPATGTRNQLKTGTAQCTSEQVNPKKVPPQGVSQSTFQQALGQLVPTSARHPAWSYGTLEWGKIEGTVMLMGSASPFILDT